MDEACQRKTLYWWTWCGDGLNIHSDGWWLLPFVLVEAWWLSRDPCVRSCEVRKMYTFADSDGTVVARFGRDG